LSKHRINNILLTCIFITCLTAALYIISTDLGNFATQPAGAGDIWWADIPLVEEAYQNLSTMF